LIRRRPSKTQRSRKKTPHGEKNDESTGKKGDDGSPNRLSYYWGERGDSCQRLIRVVL